VLGEGWLEIDRHNVGIAKREDFWLDLAEFRDRLEDCNRHAHKPDEICLDCLTQLSDAVALYRGDFLAGFDLGDSLEFDEWKTLEANDLRTDVTWALTRLVYGFSSQGNYDEAISHARHWLRLDSLHEPAHRQLIQLYAWKGDWLAARQHYESFKSQLVEKLEVAPEEATQQLYELIQMEKVPSPPTWGEGNSTRYVRPRHNLPPQLTPFVGRENELIEIADRLGSDPACRMLTLVGPGGVGKTRLALQAAAQMLEQFRHGVFLVPLSSIEVADHLIPAIADALLLSFQGRATPKDQLLNYLREKQLLLILDNFEQFVKHADLLLEILNHASAVKLLITSRERLNVSPEWVQPVLGLTYPDPMRELSDASSGPAALDPAESFSAVKLLLERATRVNPHLLLTEKDKASAIRVCQLLQGVPLGIELASSWTRILTLEEIAQEIEHSLDFLVEPARDASRRHSSLRAIFEQSWQYLSEEEKRAYQGLSIFHGGFTRKAAEQIVGISLVLLSELTDKSLIYRNPSGRYNLHQVSRQYAEEKLAESAESAETLRDQHSAYYSVYLNEREKELRLGGQSKALSEIASEVDNIRAAWHWAINRRRIQDLDRSLESLSLFYYAIGWIQEGEKAFREAALFLKSLQTGTGQVDPEVTLLYIRALIREARFAYRLGIHRDSSELLAESLMTLQGIARNGNPDAQREMAAAQFYLSVILRGEGEYQAAENICRKSLDYFEKQQDAAWIAATEKQLGIIAGSQGKYELARQWLRAARKQYQEIDDLYGLADTLNDLGNVAIGQGDFTEARRLNQKCLVLRQKTNHLWGIGTSLNNLGYLALAQQNFDEARRLLERSLTIQREIGDLYQIANGLSNLGQAAYGQNDYEVARNYYLEALGYARKTGAQPLLLEIITGVVALEIVQGSLDTERAAALLAFVQEHPASDQMTQDRADTELTVLAKSMSASQLKKAHAISGALNLEELVQELLD
jgi:predicted ATPase/Tfp pilus assembly protein PilF